MNCAFCNKELSSKERNNTDPLAYNFMCSEHHKFRRIYLLDVLKKEIGLLTIADYPDYMKECGICKTELTEEQINDIKLDDYIPTCEKHLEARRWVNKQLGIDWFEFKELNKISEKFSEIHSSRYDEFRKFQQEKYNNITNKN